MASLTVPCIADQRFKDRLKVLAATRNTSMAQLVRAALDAAYKADLENVDSFFALDVSQETQSKPESIKDSTS